MTAHQRAAVATGLAGLIAIAVVVWLSAAPLLDSQASACWPTNAVLKFEFATADQLGDLFTPACAEVTPRLMDGANKLDVYAFIPAYTALNLLAIVFLMGGFGRPTALAAAVAAVGALVADNIETVNLLLITQDLAANAHLLDVSRPAAWLKFALLAAHSALLAQAAFGGGRRILGIVLLLPIAGTAAMALNAGQPSFDTGALAFTVAAVAAWLTITVVALREGLRRG